MLCQSCGKRPANTHIKTIINGELTEHSLCSECAQKMGYGNSFFPSNTFDQFFSSFFGKNSLMEDTLRCPVCGASLSDISDTGKVGCADCYKTFLNQLMPSIQRMHRQYPPYRKNSNGNCFAGSGTNRRKRTAERKK